MPIYLITAITNPGEVGQAVQEKVPDPADRYRVAASTWLVRHPGTTKELSDLIGATADQTRDVFPLGSVLVTLVGSYYGRAQPDMWEWIQTRLGK